LDRLEKISETVQSSTKAIIETTKTVSDNLNQKVVVPVDEYLKESKLAAPLNAVLDVTEGIVNRILPPMESEKEDLGQPADQKTSGEENKEQEEEEEEEDEEDGEDEEEDEEEEAEEEITIPEKPTKTVGPVIRASMISKSVQRRAFAKLKGLALRSPDKIQRMNYVVDLIQYAASNLDGAGKLFTESVQKSVEYVHDKEKTVVAAVPDFNEVRRNFQKAALNASEALVTAANAISHMSPTIKALPLQTYDALRRKASSLRTRKEVEAFAKLCQKGTVKLQEANAVLQNYIRSHEKIPQQLVFVTEAINVVLESFISEDNKQGTEVELKDSDPKVRTDEFVPSAK